MDKKSLVCLRRVMKILLSGKPGITKVLLKD